MYQITDYTLQRAKEYGVDVKPSTNRKKKIDIFYNGEKIASVGAIGYRDFPTYMEEKGMEYAMKRRRLYYIRHRADIAREGTPGWWAAVLLW